MYQRNSRREVPHSEDVVALGGVVAESCLAHETANDQARDNESAVVPPRDAAWNLVMWQRGDGVYQE